MSTLKILHWNDVYKVGPHRNEAGGNIDVTQFSALVEDIRAQWMTLPNGQKDGLTLFSGDLFSPSVESTITRGSHMVPVINELAPDTALTGNHDFDFGYPHLTKLVQDCKFPWILSNIVDSNTSLVPEHLHEFQIFERAGVRIGVIGLVERDWIATVSTWPVNFDFKDMHEVGQELSRSLRDPQGDHRCDIIIALTHSRLPNDIALAKKLLAISPAGQGSQPISDEHGVDVILGGHDHFYYVGKGIEKWEGYNQNETVLGAERDVGDVLVVKSGCNFLDLSEITIVLEPTPPGSVRNQIIKQISGKRFTTASDYRSSESMKKLTDILLKSVSSSLKVPVCRLVTELNLRSPHIRTRESAGGNWFADILHHAYDDALCLRGCGGADGVLICAGTLRGDSVYGPGHLTLGNILEILPFEDPIIVVEMDGATLWEVLEAALSLWPAHEGRFPVISGFRVEWDSRRTPRNRLLGVWLVAEMDESDHGLEAEHYDAPVHAFTDLEPIKKEKGGRKYKIVTREYLADGHDGYDALKGQEHLIDHEGGSLMSTLVRRYLLGAQFVTKMSRMAENANHSQLRANTRHEMARTKSRKQRVEVLALNAINRWKGFVQRKRSKMHFRNQFNVCLTENMGIVDAFDGPNARQGKMVVVKGLDITDDLLVVAPMVDGRLNDKACSDPFQT